MRYFPKRLKLRAPGKRDKKNAAGDRIFDTRADLLAGAGRGLTYAKEGRQWLS